MAGSELIIGAVFGVALVFAGLYILYLRGALAVLIGQNKVLESERAASKINLANLAAKVQELKKPMDVHFTDEQLHKLAMLVNDRVVRLYSAQQAEDITKLH